MTAAQEQDIPEQYTQRPDQGADGQRTTREPLHEPDEVVRRADIVRSVFDALDAIDASRREREQEQTDSLTRRLTRRSLPDRPVNLNTEIDHGVVKVETRETGLNGHKLQREVVVVSGEPGMLPDVVMEREEREIFLAQGAMPGEVSLTALARRHVGGSVALEGPHSRHFAAAKEAADKAAKQQQATRNDTGVNGAPRRLPPRPLAG